MPRVKITVSLPMDIIHWLSEKVKDGTFPNISAGVESCIEEKIKKSSRMGDHM